MNKDSTDRISFDEQSFDGLEHQLMNKASIDKDLSMDMPNKNYSLTPTLSI